MTGRRRIVIRKQRPEHVRDGRPAKWCGACHCGRAAIATQHADVITWADLHRCSPAAPTSSAIRPISLSNVHVVPSDLWQPHDVAAEVRAQVQDQVRRLAGMTERRTR